MANAFAREVHIGPSLTGTLGGFSINLEVAYTGTDVQDGYLNLPVQVEIAPAATATEIMAAITQAVIDGGANRGLTLVRRDVVIPVWAKG